MELQKDRFYTLVAVAVLGLVLMFGHSALKGLALFSGIQFWVILILICVLISKIFDRGITECNTRKEAPRMDWLKLLESDKASTAFFKVCMFISALITLWRLPDSLKAIAPNGFFDGFIFRGRVRQYQNYFFWLALSVQR